MNKERKNGMQTNFGCVILNKVNTILWKGKMLDEYDDDDDDDG